MERATRAPVLDLRDAGAHAHAGEQASCQVRRVPDHVLVMQGDDECGLTGGSIGEMMLPSNEETSMQKANITWAIDWALKTIAHNSAPADFNYPTVFLTWAAAVAIMAMEATE